MFKVVEPLVTSNHANTVKAVSALNDGVRLSDVNVSLKKSIMQNRTKRQRSAARAKQAMRY